MNHTIKRCIALTCRSNFNSNTRRNFGTRCLITCDRLLPRRAFMTKFNSQINDNKSSRNAGGGVTFRSTSDLKLTEENREEQNYPASQLKKRPKKRKSVSAGEESNDAWNVKALATSEEYNLEALVNGLIRQNLYVPNTISTSTSSVPEVVHAVAKYEVEHEPREIFFFEEGTVVMWNVSELECENILDFLRKYERNRYADYIVQSESEQMRYCYTDDGKQSHLRNGIIMVASNVTNLDKYTFSNAMAQSVKLGIWEASLDNYIDSIAFVTEDLKAGRKLRMTQQEVLRKQGELFKLRHSINLSSDLLDTPDFYWDRDDLERVYQETCSYFNIAKRTRVINEKLNHCVELVAIVSSHLSDRHHIRLEWMIIILIMVEVAFEILHYVDKYFS